MDKFQELKAKFEELVSKQGYVSETDYNEMCSDVEDHTIINKVAHWLLSSGIKLHKAIGPQYQQELLRKVKSPDVKDVVDTKHRTHKNPNKFQQSKKKGPGSFITETELRELAEHERGCPEKGASFHLNKVIEELKDKETKDEFLPAWKKFDPEDTGKHPLVKYPPFSAKADEYGSHGELRPRHGPSDKDSVIAYLSKMQPHEEIDDMGLARIQHIEEPTATGILNELLAEGVVTKSDNGWFAPTPEFLRSFLTMASIVKRNPVIGKLLSTFGITADTWDIPFTSEFVRNYILDLSSKIGDRAYVDSVTFPQFANVNFGNLEESEKALANIDDVELLRNLQMAIEGGNYSTEPQEGTATPWEKQPSSVDNIIDFGTDEEPSIELAHLAASMKTDTVTIGFANGTKFVAPIADTPAKKAAGLEVFESLKTEEGLYFPFEEPDSVTFHMGKVKFPIDIIFLMETPHGMEVNKVVSDAQPGTMEYWTSKNVKAVLEVSGGVCKEKGIKVGSLCKIASSTRQMRICA